MIFVSPILQKPRWARNLIWDETDAGLSISAESSLTAPPLPDAPYSTSAAMVIAAHPELFVITTPLQPDALAIALRDHPNRLLVNSWVKALRVGVWPFAASFDKPPPPIPANKKSALDNMDALRATRDSEIAAGRWSPPFTHHLPGMRVSPLSLVPKLDSDKLRLVTDQSFPYEKDKIKMGAVNDAFTKDARKVQYDTVGDFAAWLRTLARDYPNHFRDPTFMLWKADAAHAFRLIPIHPYWQLNQIVEVDGAFHVDRCLVFGGGTSPRVWCSFASLLVWIVRHTDPGFVYVDDFFGASFTPPNESPTGQQTVLNLFRQIGVPYDLLKAPFGRCIEITGITVNLDDCSLSISDTRRNHLVARLIEWESHQESRSVRIRTIQQFTGWLNWAATVMPELRPFMSSLYRLVTPNAAFTKVTSAISPDLARLRSIVATHPGTQFLLANSWQPDMADITAWVDACTTGSGLGIYFPQWNLGFYASFPPTPGSKQSINLLEAAAIYMALQYLWSLRRGPRALSQTARILIYNDNTSAVSAYEKLYSASIPRNSMIRQLALHRLANPGISTRFAHVPGDQNVVADALSRRNLDMALAAHPNLIIKALPTPYLVPVAALNGPSDYLCKDDAHSDAQALLHKG
jgi:hypothetical protein